jgi:uncharacterized OsmC-like protein
MAECPPAGPNVSPDSTGPRPGGDAEGRPTTRSPSSGRGASPPPVARQPAAPAGGQGAGAATRRTLRCRTVGEGQLRQLNHIRDLPPLALEGRVTPAEHDAAPTPSEVLLAALGSCLATAIRASALARAIAVRGLEVEVEADCDPSALWGVVGADGPKPVGFEAVRVRVRVEADAPREVLRTLVANALLWSPVGGTIHDPVHIDLELA